MLKPWNQADPFLKCDAVKEYYTMLEKKKGQLLLKRLFDIVMSAILLVILSPAFLIIAIAIKRDSKGPVFYRQTRVTANNRDFRIFKFRTMIEGADKKGTLITVDEDSRITKIGEKIRRVRLDEIPQLFNILAGDMSFVGTRPEVRKYVDYYTDEMKATLLLPAGVTSLASIEFKDEDLIIQACRKEGMSVDEAYVKRILPEKMKYNLDAMKNFGFFKEIGVMFKTVSEVFR